MHSRASAAGVDHHAVTGSCGLLRCVSLLPQAQQQDQDQEQEAQGGAGQEESHADQKEQEMK